MTAHFHANASTADNVVSPGTEPMPLGARTTDRRWRLLLPVRADAEAQWGVRYALQRDPARRLEVLLLHVASDLAELPRHLHRGGIGPRHAVGPVPRLLGELTRMLASARIPVRQLQRHGELVRTILDIADETACDELVLPQPPHSLWQRLVPGPVSRLCRLYRAGNLVLVDRHGRAQALAPASAGKPAQRAPATEIGSY